MARLQMFCEWRASETGSLTYRPAVTGLPKRPARLADVVSEPLDPVRLRPLERLEELAEFLWSAPPKGCHVTPLHPFGTSVARPAIGRARSLPAGDRAPDMARSRLLQTTREFTVSR